MTRYVALYCRLSPRPDGTYEGVPAQAKWGRTYAAKTWPGVSVKVFSDAGISAANGDHRPAYEALREAVARGEVAHLWTVEQTRLERRETGWFRLAAELDAAGIAEVHTKRDGIVRVLDDVAGIKAVLAAGEVRRIKARVNDKLAENAANGVPAGSRPFGYTHARKTLVIVEDEAAIIRECAERVLAGWSLTRIAADLVGRGLHGPHRVKVRDANGNVVTEDGRPADDGGKPVTRASKLSYKSVQSWVTNPTVAGLRVHQGVTVGAGNWPPILDEATWRAVRNKLSAPRVVHRRDGGTYPITGAARYAGRRYLLTGGTAVCGVCGAPLVASMKQRKNDVTPYYLCHPRTGGRGCVGIMAEPFEKYVVRVLLDELDKPAFRDALAADEHAERRDEITTALAALDQQRADLAKEWSRRDITMAEWRIARDGLAGEERRLRADLAAVPPPVSRVDLAAIREGWQAMNLDEQRDIIAMFIDKVAVNRATPPYRAPFNPGRVAPVDTWWRRA